MWKWLKASLFYFWPIWTEVLTKKIVIQRQGKRAIIHEIPPNPKIVLAINLTTLGLFCATVLQIIHLAVLGSFNDSIWAFISGQVSFVVGVLLGVKS